MTTTITAAEMRDEAPARPPEAPALPRRRLPNGMEIAYQSRSEVEFFYDDVFEKEVYLRHGVTLRDGDCVFDVGANVGFFTMFVHSKCDPSAVYSFEPAPPIFRVLSENAARYAHRARLFNCGLSDAEKTASFTFYPQSSGMSSFYGDEAEEKEALRKIMVNQWRKGMAEMEQVMRHADDLLEERFRSETFECRLRTLSDVVAEFNVERIDLLKIDVQKSEMDVLAGIGEDDWRKVRQIVIEVHDTDGRLREVSALLARRGFEVVVEQDDIYEGSILYNLYATRRSALLSLGEGAAESSSQPSGQRSLGDVRERARRQGEALGRQRQITRKGK